VRIVRAAARPHAARPMATAPRAALPRPTRAALSRPTRAALSLPTRAARPQRVARRPIAVLAVLTLAAALVAAILLGGGSAPAPAGAGIVPLRVSSGQGIATGFALARGRVVTVAHVIDGPVTVRERRVRVIRLDRRSDLALLSVPGLHAHRPAITSAANGEHLRVGRLRDGRPSMLSVHVRRSIVAHVRALGASRALVRPALELSAAEGGRVAPGDSGAAVVTDSGGLAGVVFAASRSRPDTAYAVDASQLRRLLRRP
jgi:hypothetical protein